MSDFISSPFDIIKAMTSGLSLQETLDSIVGVSIVMIGARAAAISLLDDNTKELVVEAASGLAGVGKGLRVALNTRPTGWVAGNQQSVAIADMAKDPDRDVQELARRENVVSYLGVPIMLRGRCIGVIEVYAADGAPSFADDDVETLRVLGGEAAMAVENARLFQAERDTVIKLRQLERHKNDFVAMIAHELRTPMTSIKGFAQLLLRQNACCKPEITERYARIIEAESNRMISIINDILDISKMEAGLLDMWKQPLSLSELIRRVVEDSDHLYRGHALELEVSESLPLVRGDATKIEQVLINLVGNAVKYSPEGEPIQIGASADDEGVTIWVNDRGRTIPVHKFDHIFDKFNGSDGDSASGEMRSSGLGLYISKNFVEAHGGRIWVESEEGKGARFLFKLYY